MCNRLLDFWIVGNKEESGVGDFLMLIWYVIV